jgi:hypothetical protein
MWHHTGTEFSPAIIIPPALHTRIRLHVDLIRRTKGEVWEPSKKRFFFGNRGALNREELPLLWFLQHMETYSLLFLFFR